MDLQTPCNACIVINRNPASAKQSFSRNISIPRNRCKTVSELRAAVAVNGDARPSPVPSHKVTVHDRCCTSCAVRVKSGELKQPEALGISAELKSKGYALLCVGFPSSDLEVETQDEDEVYWLQFGRYFARGPIERDDYALELAMGDE